MPVDFLKDFAGELESRINSCKHHPEQWAFAETLEESRQQWEWVQQCRPEARIRHLRHLAKTDLYFLGRYILGWEYADHPWQFDRAREVQADPNGYLDLWARGHMKCAARGSLITLADGSRKPIEWMVAGDRVLVVTSGGRAATSFVEAVRSNGVRTVRRFRTKTGREFSITDNHVMMGPNGTWVRGDELRVGSWVALPRVVARQPRESMTIEQAAYLGFIMADGCTSAQGNGGYYSRWTNADADVTERFCEVSRSCGFGIRILRKSSAATDYSVTGAGKFHKRMGVAGCKAIDKRVPRELFSQPDSHLWAFLAAFFDCDGTIGTSGKQAIICLANPGLIDDLRHICDLLGLRVSTTRKRENGFAGSWNLTISNQQSLRLMTERAPLSHGRKRAKLQDISSRKLCHEWGDPVPTGWERYLVNPIKSRIFRNSRVSISFPLPASTARSKVARFAEIDDSSVLKNYIAADVRWDLIVEISKPYEIETFDIQIAGDGKSTFHLNGVISHNSHWITHANAIREVLNNPEISIVIFSYNRPAAKAHLRVIKQQFEQNGALRELFPEIIWKRLDDAPKWSEDDGICVKRSTVRLEQTVEAWGLIDGQPVGRHFDLMIYDDVVTADLVSNADMIANVTNKWELSLSLGQPETKNRYVGTFYHENDTYHTMIDRGIQARRHPIYYEDGPLKGEPVFFTKEHAEERRRQQGSRNFAFQYLLDPAQDDTKQRWRFEWLGRYGHKINSGVNVYILVDPANEQRKHSDYTTMAVIGLGADQNYYLLDLIRDRLNLKQRTERLFALHQKYMRKGGGMKPQDVGYEMYGKDSDIQHIQEKMDSLNYHFNITPLAGRLSKKDRINKLQPSFEEHRWWLPQQIFQTDYEGKQVELISTFIQEEYLFWPDPKHDDMLDCLSRILDPKFFTVWPVGEFVGALPDYPEPIERPPTWQSA